jgi:ribose transport system substrate-binding protein
MTINPRRIAVGCAALITAAALTTAMPSAHAATAKKKRIAFSPLSLSVPALKGLSEGVKGVGASKGLDVTVLDPNFDPNKQAQQLTQLITAKKIDAAWVISVNPGAMKAVVRLAQKKKVALVLNGVPEDYGFTGLQKGLTFANIKYAEFGGALGSTAAECITSKLSGKGQVIFLTSAPGTAGKEENDRAVTTALAALPGVKIVATEPIKDRSEAQTKVGQILQANPDANVVIASADEGGLGALGAFAAANKTATCVIDGGGNAEVLDAQKAGKIFAVAALQFDADLFQTIEELGRLMAKPGSTGQQLSVPLKIVK